MDPNTGRTYALGKEIAQGKPPGTFLDVTELRDRIEALDRPATSDELRAATEAESLVLVDEQVVQKLELGERELERRKRRRKAAKAARKRNR